MADPKNKHYRYLEQVQRQMDVDDEEDQKLHDALNWALDQINPDRKKKAKKTAPVADQVPVRKAFPRLRLVKND